jgi:hypothetical protein
VSSLRRLQVFGLGGDEAVRIALDGLSAGDRSREADGHDRTGSPLIERGMAIVVLSSR